MASYGLAAFERRASQSSVPHSRLRPYMSMVNMPPKIAKRIPTMSAKHIHPSSGRLGAAALPTITAQILVKTERLRTSRIICYAQSGASARVWKSGKLHEHTNTYPGPMFSANFALQYTKSPKLSSRRSIDTARRAN